MGITLHQIRGWLSKEQFFGQGGYCELFRIAYPLLFLSASNVIMQFADRRFLGNSSTEEMAASLPAASLFNSLTIFFLVATNFTNAFVSQHYGAGRRRQCVLAAWNGFYFALCSGVVILFCIPWIGYWVLHSPFASENVSKFGWVYFLSLLPGAVFQCLGAPFFSFYSGRGRTLPVALINIGVCLFNIFLNWLLIFGHWGMPRLGILGAGVATSLSLGVGFVMILTLFLRIDQRIYPTRTLRTFSGERLNRLIRFGFPSGLQVLSNCMSFTVIILLVGRLGDMALAATTIALSINMLGFMPMVAIADSTLILTGQYIGRGLKTVAESIPPRAWRLAVAYVFLMLFVYLFLTGGFIDSFRPASDSGPARIDFSEVARQGWLTLLMMGLWGIPDSLRYIFGGAMRGAGDTRMLMVINLVCAWLVGIPGFVFLVYVVRPAPSWVWSYFIVVATVEGYWTFRRFRSGAWRRIRLVREEGRP